MHRYGWKSYFLTIPCRAIEVEAFIGGGGVFIYLLSICRLVSI